MGRSIAALKKCSAQHIVNDPKVLQGSFTFVSIFQVKFDHSALERQSHPKLRFFIFCTKNFSLHVTFIAQNLFNNNMGLLFAYDECHLLVLGFM